MTIEDPVEYRLEGITQVAANEAIGLTFSAVLRSILRQDPNIIMVGEIRDQETAEIAIRAAMTGHLVLSTLHTNDTVAAISRLVDIGIEPFLMTSISGIFAQRLVKKICPACKTAAAPSIEVDKAGLPPLKATYKGAGCEECNQTGYRGRVGVYEFLLMDAKIKRMVAEKASEDELWAAAREAGIVTLFEDAWEKVSEGLTTVEEVIAKVPYSRFVLSPPLSRDNSNAG
jgi:type IV pilus assembly protein PilB